ncbi:MAG: hypothetical protein E7649_01570 [Ruminococcaceae bacterium]|nr:hypothetical protein [Oscillospiraceae bacterium]
MIYSITDFGAKPENTINTKEIQSAIDACFLAGGGEVTVPAGDFVTGGLRLRSNVTLHLLANAHLVGSLDPEDYVGYINDEIEPIPEDEREAVVSTVVEGHVSRSAIPYSRWNNAIIRAIKAKNIAIIGDEGSIIDGQNCFDEQGEEHYRGPHAINMWFCEDIRLEGYTVKDSANWAHAIHNSQNISVRGITVLAGHDGFDVRTCDNVLVEDSSFLTGDDCIAGFDNIGVLIRNCYFESSCSLLRFGGTDVLVENCHGKDPATYGFRGHLSPEQKKNRADTDENCRHTCHNIFLYYCDNRANIRRTPGNIVIRSCTFDGIKKLLNQPFGHVWCCNRALDNITFEDCTVNGLYEASSVTCPEGEPLTVTLKNCRLTARQGFENANIIEGTGMRSIVFDGVTLQGFTAPTVVCNAKCEVSSDTPIRILN